MHLLDITVTSYIGLLLDSVGIPINHCVRVDRGECAMCTRSAVCALQRAASTSCVGIVVECVRRRCCVNAHTDTLMGAYTFDDTGDTCTHGACMCALARSMITVLAAHRVSANGISCGDSAGRALSKGHVWCRRDRLYTRRSEVRFPLSTHQQQTTHNVSF